MMDGNLLVLYIPVITTSVPSLNSKDSLWSKDIARSFFQFIFCLHIKIIVGKIKKW